MSLDKKHAKSQTIKKEDLKDFRMYREEYPKIDDLVMAEVTRIEDTGVYLKLLEYKNLEGLMMLSELSKRRWRTVSKLVQVNRKEIVMVMRVDREKGYVDLSKKRVPPNEREKFMEKFKNSSIVHSILKQVCAISDYSIEKAYKSFGWKLYDDFPHAIEGLASLNTSPKSFYERYEVPEEIKKALETNVSRRLTKRSKKVRAIFEINCYVFEGIESIKAALLEGQKGSTEEVPIVIHLISSPRYSIMSTAKNVEKATERIVNALEAIKTKIVELKGNFVIIEGVSVDNDYEKE